MALVIVRLTLQFPPTQGGPSASQSGPLITHPACPKHVVSRGETVVTGTSVYLLLTFLCENPLCLTLPLASAKENLGFHGQSDVLES